MTTQAATRRDFEELDTRMKETEARLETRIAELKAEIVKWMIGLLFVQAGFIVAMIKL
jgi:tetrahydromethanopterin S-methyltransferase subunit G